MEPIKFKPILKQTLWGGGKIVKFKGIDGHEGEQIGESWELSGVPGNESVAANGEYEGRTLTEIVAAEKERLVGTDNYKRFGDEFPLLIKFIDAKQDLSIQVHPDDEKAQKYGLRNGKTEMWYIMNSDADASLRCGMKAKITPERYKEMVADGTICDAIAEYPVKEDDCFFIPAGRIHSIGKGCFLAEIQQTSDATYRIYDFNRRDKDGNLRELHTEKAAECIDYTVLNDYRTEFTAEKNRGVQIVSCPFFNTAVYDLDEPMTLDYSELDSFVVLIGLKGEARLTDNEGNTTTLRGGETLLVPASTATIKVDGNIKFLETYA
ncbi:MAG TPA: class I mannose-6-phosphate isomerase [Candidatus Prevotella stercoripullorum]|nr:class I mannose-6-phosphate isomerase [Candidatus Prevotella stercoripullorum]